MSTELRIKLQHIGMEPGIIRKHEQRIKRRIAHIKNKQSNQDVAPSYAELHRLQHHRRWDVRNAARATHLALGYIRGKPYSEMEDPNLTNTFKRDAYIVSPMMKMIRRYGDDDVSSKMVHEWFET